MPGSHGRREFLSPASFGRLLAAVTGGDWKSNATAETSQGWLCRASREAMATKFEVLFDAIDSDRYGLVEKALDLVGELESQLTVYNEESEIGVLNRKAFREEAPVEENLYALLKECRDLWVETEGAFDVTLHALLKAWGVFRGPPRKLTAEQVEEHRKKCGQDKVHLNDETRTVRFGVEGLGINLGAIGKGYSLDRVGGLLLEGGLEHFLVHGGHSSIVARGSSTWEKGWLISVAHPLDWQKSVAKIRLLNESLSTSALKRDTIEGERVSHTIDPRTGHPAETDLISVSVLAETAARAEALSTGLSVMGLDKALDYCEKHRDIGGLLIRLEPDSDSPEIIHRNLSNRIVEVLN